MNPYKNGAKSHRSFQRRYKTWNLDYMDWTMDWTMDWILDSIAWTVNSVVDLLLKKDFKC